MRQCAICEKGSIMRGKRKKLRGNYNPTTKQRKHPNLQWARIDGARVKVCTSCLKKRAK